jgi:hypothetical protein
MVMAQMPLPFPVEPGSELEYLTVAEAAERLRCCERTIRRADSTRGCSATTTALPDAALSAAGADGGDASAHALGRLSPSD